MDQCLLNLTQMGLLRNGYEVVILQRQTHLLAKRHSTILSPPHDVLCYSRVFLVTLVTDSLCGFVENVLNCL